MSGSWDAATACMLRAATDEAFNGRVVAGLLRRLNPTQLLSVQAVGLVGLPDPDVLAWAAAEGRVLFTNDYATMPAFAFDRIAAGHPMTGVCVVAQQAPIGPAIDAIHRILVNGRLEEWRDRVVYLHIV